MPAGLVLFVDDDFTSPVFGELYSLYSFHFAWYSIHWSLSKWAWLWTRLTLSCSIGFVVYTGSSSHCLRMMAERGGTSVVIFWCFASGSGTLVGLRTIVVNFLLKNVSIIPETVVYDSVLTYSSGSFILSSRFGSVSTTTTPSDLGSSFVCLATHPRRWGCSFFEVIKSCTLLALFLCSSGRSLIAIIDIGMEL